MDDSLPETSILSTSDPAPVTWYNGHAASPLLLLCEHAGNQLPERLGTLGLSRAALAAHIAWDIGAAALARALSDRLGAPLILQRYSRLMIDCNRPPDTSDSIPSVSDDTQIPGNSGLMQTDRDQRRQAVFDPLENALHQGLTRAARKAVFSIHSFTPVFQGQPRPWHAGFLTRKDVPMAQALMRHIAAQDSALNIALNQPYQIDDDTDWFIPRYAEPRGMRHALIEVRNDLLGDGAGVEHWADLLAGAIEHQMETFL